tara:strand:- start:281 stop:487 length:207 start_codon:yes stop_codon:yes gene_type:complete
MVNSRRSKSNDDNDGVTTNVYLGGSKRRYNQPSETKTISKKTGFMLFFLVLALIGGYMLYKRNQKKSD